MQATARHRAWRYEATLILLVLVAGGLVKNWLIAATPVLARDGIGFIDFARRLGEEPWGDVLRTTTQHPLYPVHVLAVGRAYEGLAGRPLSPVDWQRCAQLANAWLGVLLVVPMYLLGRALGGRWVALGAVILFQVLPVPARNTADALSEGTYLFLAVTGLWLIVRGLQSGRVGWFLAAGVAGGLAYLTRPEGAVIVLAGGFSIIGTWWWQVWPVRWSRCLACGLCLGVATLATVAPYWLTIGGLSSKNTFKHLVSINTGPRPAAAFPVIPVASGGLFASRFTPGVDGVAYDDVSGLFAVLEAFQEVGKGFNYVVWLPAAFGIWVACRRLRYDGASRLAAVLCLAVVALNLLMLGWLAFRAHYVSERHTLLLVLVGCCFAALGVQAAVVWLAERRATGWMHRPRAVMAVVVVVLVGWGLIRTLRPMHEQRIGHRDAGLWFANHHAANDKLVDPYGWATFYAGKRYTNPPLLVVPGEVVGTCYLVEEPGEKDGLRKRIIRSATAPRDRKVPVLTWPDDQRPRVVFYRIERGVAPPPSAVSSR